MAHPVFGRSLAIRGFDATDTPPAALGPIFSREPLLQGVTEIAEPFAGAGWLATAMRAKGITVHAGDIHPRGCPDCATRDFFDLTRAPCGVLLSNPPYRSTEPALGHAWKIGFRTVILLLRTTFLHSVQRYETIHKSGRLARVFVLAERLTMHDQTHLAAGGKTASQSQTHAWFTFDAAHYGPATIVPASINNPNERMPWEPSVLRLVSRQG
jgi:hypothetical protein